MIDITHAQAQRLIRAELDRVIPEAQWNALQAHLEGCAECRAYQNQRKQLEKHLRRAMRAYWTQQETLLDQRRLSGAHPLEVSEAVNEIRRTRVKRLKLAGRAALALLGLVFLVAFARLVWPVPPPLTTADAVLLPATATFTPTRTSSPTPVGNGFQGRMVFAAFPPGGAEQPTPGTQLVPGSAYDIFLLSADPGDVELFNLTKNPAADISPIWSPDGAWIAFLSNRDRPDGNFDLYVISVAGTRLTRLTADTHITWRGPLSWSADGRWIAAVGSHFGGPELGASGLFMIPLDGSAPQLVSNGGSLPKFSPVGTLLAFASPNEVGLDLFVYDYTNRAVLMITANRSAQQPQARLALGDEPASGDTFDWNIYGSELLFMTETNLPDATGSLTRAEVRETTNLSSALEDFGAVKPPRGDGLNNWSPRRVSRDASIRSVTWSPFGDLLFTRQADPESPEGCSRTLASTPAVSGQSQLLRSLNLPRLCMIGGLSRANWSSEASPAGRSAQASSGDWLALQARRPEALPGIYAIKVPDPAEGQRVVQVQRLIDLPPGAGSLQVQPTGRPGADAGPAPVIDPRPTRPLTALPLVELTGSSAPSNR